MESTYIYHVVRQRLHPRQEMGRITLCHFVLSHTRMYGVKLRVMIAEVWAQRQTQRSDADYIMILATKT